MHSTYVNIGNIDIVIIIVLYLYIKSNIVAIKKGIKMLQCTNLYITSLFTVKPVLAATGQLEQKAQVKIYSYAVLNTHFSFKSTKKFNPNSDQLRQVPLYIYTT